MADFYHTGPAGRIPPPLSLTHTWLRNALFLYVVGHRLPVDTDQIAALAQSLMDDADDAGDLLAAVVGLPRTGSAS
jgi:hypothetical protein